MTKHFFVTCDVCNQEILAEDPPHQTRYQFDFRQFEDEMCVIDPLPRRDMCDACATRVRQVIIAYLPNCLWLLDGFEVQK